MLPPCSLRLRLPTFVSATELRVLLRQIGTGGSQKKNVLGGATHSATEPRQPTNSRNCWKGIHLWEFLLGGDRITRKVALCRAWFIWLKANVSVIWQCQTGFTCYYRENTLFHCLFCGWTLIAAKLQSCVTRIIMIGERGRFIYVLIGFLAFKSNTVATSLVLFCKARLCQHHASAWSACDTYEVLRWIKLERKHRLIVLFRYVPNTSSIFLQRL